MRNSTGILLLFVPFLDHQPDHVHHRNTDAHKCRHHKPNGDASRIVAVNGVSYHCYHAKNRHNTTCLGIHPITSGFLIKIIALSCLCVKMRYSRRVTFALFVFFYKYGLNLAPVYGTISLYPYGNPSQKCEMSGRVLFLLRNLFPRRCQ